MAANYLPFAFRTEGLKTGPASLGRRWHQGNPREKEEVTQAFKISKLANRGLMLVVLFPALVICVGAQRPAPNSAATTATRGQINDETFRELMRVERESINSSAPSSDAGRKALLKQLREDFKAVQELNNKMMAEAWSREPLDYQGLAKMISDINVRAIRLKANLSLPPPETDRKKYTPAAVSNLKDFRAALLRMDQCVMSFVRNPVFQKPDVVEINSAAQASYDLENVIALSSNLKKMAASLAGSGTRQ